MSDDLRTRDFLNASALMEILKLMNQLKKTLALCWTVKIIFISRQKSPGTDVHNYQLTTEAQKCIHKLRNDLYTKMLDDLRTQDFLNAASLKEILKLMNHLKKAEQHELSLVLSLAEMEKEVKLVLDTLGVMSLSEVL